MMEEDKIPRIPIIACTAHALDEDIEKCKRFGMTMHLVKPIKPLLLDRVLRGLKL